MILKTNQGKKKKKIMFNLIPIVFSKSECVKNESSALKEMLLLWQEGYIESKKDNFFGNFRFLTQIGSLILDVRVDKFSSRISASCI